MKKKILFGVCSVGIQLVLLFAIIDLYRPIPISYTSIKQSSNFTKNVVSDRLIFFIVG